VLSIRDVTRGVLQSSGFVVIVSFDSSEILEILDPPVSEIRPSGFAELDSVGQIVALHIGQKLYCPV
jgi:hypothetical protein